jgi:Cu-Zn family superoxide dismutase
VKWPAATAALGLAACAPAVAGGGRPAAIASGTLRNAAGERVGVAAVTDTAGALRLALSVGGLSPGLHAVRIEAEGRCEGDAGRADTTRADSMLARAEPMDTVRDTAQASGGTPPAGGERTLLNQPGPPVSELPDLLAGREGLADTSFALPRGLPATGPGSLLRPGGTRVVIGGGPGARSDSSERAPPPVACAVLRPA